MNDVYIGFGNLAGKGVYAGRDFDKDEVVIQYRLKPLSQENYQTLPKNERQFVHKHKGQLYLYSEPERYVNHSDQPNTYQDLERQCDVAAIDIKKDQVITTNSSEDDT